MSSPLIRAITQDKNGFIWIQHNSIGALYEDTKGNLWVGTFGGGAFMRPAAADTFKWINHSDTDPNTIANNLIVSILEDNGGDIWKN